MNRAKLYQAVEFAHAAASNATLAASYDKIKPERAEYFARLSEEAAYALIEALFEARLQTINADDVLKALAPIIETLNPQRREAA